MSDIVTKSILSLLVCGLVIAGCSKIATTQSGAEHSWTKPGVLRIAIQVEPKNLNPLLASNTTDGLIARLIFDPLISADPKGNPVPILVTEVPTLENGGISGDGLTIAYKLRHGVRWTDGQPLTSADVKFSWQAMMNPNNNVVSRHGYDEVRSIDTPNPYVLVVHLKEKFSPFVNTFFAESDSPVNIAPAHLLQKYQNINQIPFNNAPLGSGPFKFVEWIRGDHLTLEANPDYFRGKPRLREIVLHVIPDENTTLSQLRTHDIDWMFQPSYSTYQTLQSIPDILMHFNNINGYEGVYLNTAHRPLNDVTVRQAIAYAIDKKQLLDDLTYGRQQIATEDLPSWIWAYDEKLSLDPYDPEKARQLLAADGWKPGRNGILSKNGESFSLLLVTNRTNVTRRKAAVLMQSMLRQVGIDVQVKLVDGASLFAPAPAGILQTGRFDLALAGWFSGIDPDDSSNYMSKNVPPGGYNYTFFRSATMDAAQRRALENYDRPTRKKAYATIEEMLANQNIQLFFWWNRQAQAISPDFKGFDPNPVTESWNAYQWSI